MNVKKPENTTDYSRVNLPFSAELAEELLDNYGSPLYVYDGDKLAATIAEITAAIPHPKTQFQFASVTNGNISLLKIFNRHGWGLHANTPGDAFLGLKAGFDPATIVFTGSNLSSQEFEMLLNWGIATYNLDSLQQLQEFGEIFQTVKPPLSPRIGFRLNYPEITGESRIGIRPQEFPDAVKIAASCGLKITGLHFYRGTGTNATPAFTQSIQPILAIAQNLPDWHYLDFGGGFGYPYQKGNVAFDWRMFGQEITAALRNLNRDIELIIEPGRAAIAGCGTLLTKVIPVKRQDQKSVGKINMISPTHFPSNQKNWRRG
jgi:diaminopimelate decarboxylase